MFQLSELIINDTVWVGLYKDYAPDCSEQIEVYNKQTGTLNLLRFLDGLVNVSSQILSGDKRKYYESFFENPHISRKQIKNYWQTVINGVRVLIFPRGWKISFVLGNAVGTQES